METIRVIDSTAALTIAGSDSGGGAGIQADLKTFSAFGVFGTSVITAVTAQNLDGVTAIQPIEPEVVRKQLTAVLEGFPIRAIKTGMLFSAPIIETIAAALADFRHIPLVIDPVFAATSGSRLIQDEAIESLRERLFPLASLITPNIPEAEILVDEKIKTAEDLESVGQRLFDRLGVPVVVKGGHLEDAAFDVLVDQAGLKIFHSELIQGVNSHGSGCTFAAAIAAALSRGKTLRQAVSAAKEFVVGSLKHPYRLSGNIRIMNHFWSRF
jgi:hydroxymethylpyrimidine/phosphomethylpyrimidine kinase